MSLGIFYPQQIILSIITRIPQKAPDYIWGMNAVWEGGLGGGNANFLKTTKQTKEEM
ncbi:MAG: hypothetical protein ACTSSP_10780 [Candidatus Asgardarchaeia archaeon]